MLPRPRRTWPDGKLAGGENSEPPLRANYPEQRTPRPDRPTGSRWRLDSDRAPRQRGNAILEGARVKRSVRRFSSLADLGVDHRKQHDRERCAVADDAARERNARRLSVIRLRMLDAPLTAEPRMPIEVGDRDVDVERHDDLPSVELT